VSNINAFETFNLFSAIVAAELHLSSNALTAIVVVRLVHGFPNGVALKEGGSIWSRLFSHTYNKWGNWGMALKKELSNSYSAGLSMRSGYRRLHGPDGRL
jgi:hypothetical protein